MDEKNKPVTSEEFNKQIREENNLPPKEETPKKTNFVTVIMIIVFILSIVAGLTLIVLAAITVIQKANNNDKPEPNEVVTKPVIKKLTEEDVKIYEDIMDYALRIRYTKDELSVKDFTNQQILTFGANMDLTKDGKFTKKELRESIEETFGSIAYKDEDILCTIDNKPFYVYNSEKEEYSYATNVDHGHGAAGHFLKYNYFQSAEKDETNGILTIKYKIMYGKYEDDMVSPIIELYLNQKDSLEKKNALYMDDPNKPTEDETKRKEIIDKTYKDNEDKFAITTFTFEKGKKGVYAFKKVETK